MGQVVRPRYAVKQWAEIHKYGLTVLAHSTLRLPRGVKANLRRGRVLVFVVEPTPLSATEPVAADANPATAFTLCAVKLVEAEHAPPLPNPEALGLSRLAAAFDEPGFYGDSDRYATPAGYVPVCFELGAAFVYTTQYAVYRASHHSDDTELEDKTIRMFEDVTHVFVILINNGVVFRPPSEGPAAPPDVGRMFRAQSGWRWQQDLGAWDLMGMLMPLQDIPFQTSYSVTGLWARFQQW